MAMKNPNVTITFDSQGIRVMKRLADALEKANKLNESVPSPVINNAFEFGREYALATAMANEYHDEDTLTKVAEALREFGISPGDISEAISAIQSKGILFRERR